MKANQGDRVYETVSRETNRGQSVPALFKGQANKSQRATSDPHTLINTETLVSKPGNSNIRREVELPFTLENRRKILTQCLLAVLSGFLNFFSV